MEKFLGARLAAQHMPHTVLEQHIRFGECRAFYFFLTGAIMDQAADRCIDEQQFIDAESSLIARVTA